MRADGRRADELRPVEIVRDYLRYAEGSVLIRVGETAVVCAASVEAGVPSFLRGTGQGWLTAEYGMLPRATPVRTPRDRSGKAAGRGHEIQRLVGRALRAAVDLDRLGERTIVVDCDVVQADGGTRTASITGAFVAVVDAIAHLWRQGEIGLDARGLLPVRDVLAAVSVGLVEGRALLDLDFGEDSRAEVDLNVAGTAGGLLVEVQGTAEGRPFPRERLEELLDLALAGIGRLVSVQRRVLGDLAARIGTAAGA